MKHQIKSLLAAALMTALCTSAHAESDKPITLVVGYSAGGSADYVARVVAEAMGKRLGRQVIIENVVGASGMLAVKRTLSGATDGSILYMGGTDTVVVPMVNPRVTHDWERDFAPVGRLTTVPMIFAVPASSPYNSLSDLVTGLRKAKTDMSYATPGIGTMQHFYGSLITTKTNVPMLHIPYRGGAQIVNDLVGSQVDSAILVLSTAMPFLNDKRIKALSVSDTERVPVLPEVKRIGEEEGFDGIALPLWQGLFVKAGTPAATIAAYEKALLDSMAQADVKKELQKSGISPAPMSGQQLRAFIKPQAALYKDIVAAAKISLE